MNHVVFAALNLIWMSGQHIKLFKNQKINFLLKLVVSLFAISLASQVSFKITTEVPVSLQTLIIFLIPMLFNLKIGLLSIIIYIIIGAFGLPVFSGGSSGYEKLTGLTGGFFIGFIVSAIYLGFQKKKNIKNILHLTTVFIIAHCITLGFGIIRLKFEFGFEKIITSIIPPLLPGLFIKSILGAILVHIINKFATKSVTT